MKATTLATLLCLLPLWLGWYNPFQDPLRAKTAAGKRHMEKGEYEEALRQYSSALQEAPDRPELHYNIGGVKFRQEQFEDAAHEYNLAIQAEDPNVAAIAHYNRGNTLVRAQDYERAIEEYKNALKINPDDEDAKFNLEFVQRLLQQQQQQQQQQNQEQQEQDDSEQEQQEKQEPQEQDEQEEKQEQPQEEPEEEQPQEQEEQPAEQPQQEESGQPPPESPQEELTQEQAEMILNSLEQKEREERQKRREAIKAERRIDRDW